MHINAINSIYIIPLEINIWTKGPTRNPSNPHSTEVGLSLTIIILNTN